MVIETAYIEILEGKELDFEQALVEARKVVAQANGFHDMYVHRGIERPNVYMLALQWETLEDHTVGFRESDLFIQWRAIIGPFFASPPAVEHWNLIPA